MAWLSRRQLGTTVPLLLLCRNASGVATLPDSPPVCKVFDSASVLVRSREMPITERYHQTGLFYFPLFLNGDFSTGQYLVEYSYLIAASPYLRTDNFEILANGNAQGEITNMHFYQRPHADFIVQSLETGLIVKNRNPKV